jgi:hypothetical protein
MLESDSNINNHIRYPESEGNSRIKIPNIGTGWSRISIDDPERDKRTVITNTMRELCKRTDEARQNNESEKFSIEEITKIPLGAFTPFEGGRKFIKETLQEFAEKEKYIKIDNDQITLTSLGYKKCFLYYSRYT